MQFPRIFQWLNPGLTGRSLRVGALVAGLCVAVHGASAQDEKADAQHEVSDATSAAIEKIRPLMSDQQDPDAAVKNAGKILETLNALVAKLDRKSFDYAYVNQMKVQILMKAGRHLEMIEPLEECTRENLFPKDKILEMKFFLASLYFQEASSTNDQAVRKAKLTKVLSVIEDWLKQVPEPLLGSPEMEHYSNAMLIQANALYAMDNFKGALEIAQKAIRLTIDPKDITWILVFACQQQAGMPEAAAETFELFLEKFPGKKEYWPQLAQAYLYADQKLRAILTYERAQAKGAMTEPAAYTNLFNLYYMIGEYSRAAELLSSWIKTGKVESTEDAWDHVASCLQTLHREDDARKVLDEGRKKFKGGNLDFELAQYLYYDGKYPEGLKVALEAWKKGGLTKPGQVALFLAKAYNMQRDMEPAYNYLQEATKAGGTDKADLERTTKMISSGYKEWKEHQTPATPEAPKAKKP